MCTCADTKVRSFRIDTCLDKKIKNVAETEKKTPSSFLNEIVENYLEYTRYDKQMNSIIISETSIKGFLNYLTEEECKENGLTLGSKVPIQLLLLSGIPRVIDSLEVSMDHLGKHSSWFTSTFHGRGETGYWYIQNTLGMKWRCFLEGYLTGLIRSLGAESVIETMGDNLILRVNQV
jgi:hypothetical protein